MSFFKKKLPFLITISISVFVAMPLFQKGFFSMHDDTQPSRVFVIAEALKQGQFPVRWVDHLGYGYGYPIFNFYAPLPYYFGALVMLTGFKAIAATKLMFAAGILISSITMYLLGNKLWGTVGGIISTVAYVLLPYHAVQIYVRGAVGEYWAFGLLPLVVYSLIEVGESPLKGVVIGSLALAAVILVHNIIGLITFGFLSFWLVFLTLLVLIRHESKTRLLATLKIMLLGLAVAAFFWLPALGEAHFTKVNQLTQGGSDYKQHFVYIDQLWDSPWGYAGSAVGHNDGMSFKLGKLHLILAVLVGGLMVVQVIRTKNKDVFLWSGLGLFISLFMMLSWSEFIWNLNPLFAFIQYPWRFLAFSGVFMAIFVGGASQIIARQKNLVKIISVISLIGLFLWLNGKYFKPQQLIDKKDSDYISEYNLRWTISKISGEYLPVSFPIPQSDKNIAFEKILISDDIILQSSDVSANRISLKFEAKQADTLQFAIAYFPGWSVVVDGVKTKPETENSLINVTVSQGMHQMTVYFTDTPIRTFANTISFIAIIIELIYISIIRLKFNSDPKK